MSGFSLPGGSFDVCCPGTSVHDHDVDYCCVGGDRRDNGVSKRVEICIGGPSDCSTTDATASCATAVPATARDFSDRIASATNTMDSQITSIAGTAKEVSSSYGAAGSIITATIWPAVAAAAGGAVVNVALMA